MSQVVDCTLVSACFCVYKNNQHALNMEDILSKSDTLLQIPCYLVLYGDRETISNLREKRLEYGFDDITQYIELELDEIWTYQYKEKVEKNREIYWPTADPRAQIDSHLITCNKFDFVLNVMDRNPFKTSKFGWIDCFLHENGSKICEDYSPELLVDVLNNITNKYHIQVLNVTDKKFILKQNKKEYYMNYRWVICGSFFTCGKEIGYKILNNLKEIFVETVEQGYGHGEEMLNLELLDKYYDYIERSYGDYGQLINNFHGPTRNLHYIYWFILKNYMKYNYYTEAYDCAKILLDQIENKKIEYNYELYLNILIDYYMSAYFIKPIDCKSIASYIQNLRYTDEEMQKEYMKHLKHYDFTLQLHQ
jgi:hypothetical protein